MTATATAEIFAPHNFREYIGQDKAKSVAMIMVSAAKIENRFVPNVIIDGSYGLGKTSLAKVIRYEAGDKHPSIIDAAAINKKIPNLSRPMIIDEIHNLDPEVADSLNVLIDRGAISIIGCTTNPGMLPPAFRSRFRSIHLEPYTPKEIFIIISQVLAKTDKLKVPPEVVLDITKRSRLNPRVALNNLSFMFDYATVEMATFLSIQMAEKAFTTLGIDANGFTERDYAYMRAIPEDRPVGVQYLAAVTGIDAKTIELEVEPFLLQSGKIDRMPRGRIKLEEL